MYTWVHYLFTHKRHINKWENLVVRLIVSKVMRSNWGNTEMLLFIKQRVTIYINNRTERDNFR